MNSLCGSADSDGLTMLQNPHDGRTQDCSVFHWPWEVGRETGRLFVLLSFRNEGNLPLEHSGRVWQVFSSYSRWENKFHFDDWQPKKGGTLLSFSWMFISHQTDRERGGERTHLRGIWGWVISPSVRRQNNRESERERGTACLKYTYQVQYQPKILLLTSQYRVLISSTEGLCNITTSVYNYGVITVRKQGVCTATCVPCGDGKVNSSCVPWGP